MDQGGVAILVNCGGMEQTDTSPWNKFLAFILTLVYKRSDILELCLPNEAEDANIGATVTLL